MKDWHKLKPELFKKQPYYRPGCDTYLKATLEAIAHGHPQSHIDELLPWNFKPSG